jgi:hypothetical protein
VGEHRQPAGCADRRDRVARAHPFARHVGGRTPADQPPERVLDARGEAGRDQRPGDRRPAQRVIVVRVEARDLVVDRQADLAQAGDRALEPHPSRGSLGAQRRLERLVVEAHPEAEDVQLAVLERDAA